MSLVLCLNHERRHDSLEDAVACPLRGIGETLIDQSVGLASTSGCVGWAQGTSGLDVECGR